MRCLRNSTVRRGIGQLLHYILMTRTAESTIVNLLPIFDLQILFLFYRAHPSTER